MNHIQEISDHLGKQCDFIAEQVNADTPEMMTGLAVCAAGAIFANYGHDLAQVEQATQAYEQTVRNVIASMIKNQIESTRLN